MHRFPVLALAVGLALSPGFVRAQMEVDVEIVAPEELRAAEEEVVDGLAEHPGDSWGPIGWFQRWRWSRNHPQASRFAEEHPDAADWVKEMPEQARRAKKDPGKVRWKRGKELAAERRAEAKAERMARERGKSAAARSKETKGRLMAEEKRHHGRDEHQGVRGRSGDSPGEAGKDPGRPEGAGRDTGAAGKGKGKGR